MPYSTKIAKAVSIGRGMHLISLSDFAGQTAEAMRQKRYKDFELEVLDYRSRLRNLDSEYKQAGRAVKRALLDFRLLEAWRKDHPKLAEWAEVAVPESLTVFDFPAAHRVRLRTTRPYTHQPGTATTHPLPASSPTPIPACVWSRPFLPNSTTSETHKVYLNLNP
jgi:hypothetical protein